MGVLEAIGGLFGRKVDLGEADEAYRLPGWYAAKDGRTADLARYIRSGLDPDHTDRDGTTMLMVAANHGHAGVVKLLLRHGANPNFVDRWGNTALWCATREGCAGPNAARFDRKVIELLLAGGANPAQRNKAGRIPATWARDTPAVQAIFRKHGYYGEFTA